MVDSDPRENASADSAYAANESGDASTSGAPDSSGASNDSDDAIDFLELAHGRREILVRLAGQTYRLRWTRNDKLILTK